MQTPWLHDFLTDPSNKIRPWLDLRMPTFEFTEDELNTLTPATSRPRTRCRIPTIRKPRARRRRWWPSGTTCSTSWQCVKCHVVAGKLPNQDPSNMAPDLANVPDAPARGLALAVAGRTRPASSPGTRMPANFPANPEENAFPEILGGDQKLQIEAVRSYLLTLGPGGLQVRQALAVPRAGTANSAQAARDGSRFATRPAECNKTLLQPDPVGPRAAGGR